MQSVASSLPITADPFPEEPTPGTMPAASGAPQAFESVPFDESRWNAWVNQGRLADTAFKEKMRILAMLGAMGAVGAGTVWVFLGLTPAATHLHRESAVEAGRIERI